VGRIGQVWFWAALWTALHGRRIKSSDGMATTVSGSYATCELATLRRNDCAEHGHQ